MLHYDLGTYVRDYGRIHPRVLPWLQWRMPTSERVVHLTFDDGPLPGGTDQILRLLDTLGVCATFFCVGEHVERQPELVRQITEGGHAIANHGYTHTNGWKLGAEAFVRNADRAQALLPEPLQRTGLPPFRPPFGKITPAQARRLRGRYRLVMWDLMSGDFDPRTPPVRSAEFLVQRSRPGSILLFHDDACSLALNREIIPRVVDGLRRKHFEFATII